AGRVGVPPGPADGDAGVEEVGDEVVRDAGVRALEDDDAAGGGEDAPECGERVVGDVVVAALLDGGGRAVVGLADADAAGADRGHGVAHDAAVPRAAAQVDGVPAEVAEGAV